MDVMRKQAERFGTRFIMDEVDSCNAGSRPATQPVARRLRRGCDHRDWSLLATSDSKMSCGCKAMVFRHVQPVMLFLSECPSGCCWRRGSAAEEALFSDQVCIGSSSLCSSRCSGASQIMQKRVFDNNVIVHWNLEVIDVLGKDAVTGVRLINNTNQEERDMNLEGLFLAIGHTPNSQPFVHLIDHDDAGYLKTLPGTSKTNVPGMFACGDVQDHEYRQAVTAAGSGCMAAIDAERWLTEQEA